MKKILFIFSFGFLVVLGLNNAAFGGIAQMSQERLTKKPSESNFNNHPPINNNFGFSTGNNQGTGIYFNNEHPFYYGPQIYQTNMIKIIRLDKNRKPINPEGEPVNILVVPDRTPPPPPSHRHPPEHLKGQKVLMSPNIEKR